MNEKFLHIGYFITKPIERPKSISFRTDIILTASKCFCDLMPGFVDILSKGIAPKLAEVTELTDEQFDELEKISHKLMGKEELIFNDFIFDYKDALYIKEKFCPEDYEIFSLGLGREFVDMLNKELCEMRWPDTLKPDLPEAGGVFLGYDILGFEGGFHTYWCNGLQEDLRGHGLEINENGLIANRYSETAHFAELIQGDGEPVLWLPYAVYKN